MGQSANRQMKNIEKRGGRNQTEHNIKIRNKINMNLDIRGSEPKSELKKKHKSWYPEVAQITTYKIHHKDTENTLWRKEHKGYKHDININLDIRRSGPKSELLKKIKNWYPW